MRDPVEREFLLAFWKVHILHHAAEERGVYGQWMLEELHRHGYRISPGTLYPILTRMAVRGWLRADEPRRTNEARVYRLTPKGAAVLERIQMALGELYGEAGPKRKAARGLRRSVGR
jgi:DNA-binding PadR family transcriptional regulator